MSRNFVESFFPSVTAMTTRLFPNLVERVLPAEVALRCPEVTIEFWGIRTIRNPILAVGAAVGVVIGAVGMATIQASESLNEVEHETQPQQKKGLRQKRKHTQQQLYFQMAFASFGCMNVVAIPLHVIIPINQPTLTNINSLLWAMDCLMTGWSSLGLVMGCWALRHHLRKIESTHEISCRHLQMQPYASFIGLVCAGWPIVAIVRFLWYEETLGLELFYLIPTIAAGCILFPLLVLSGQTMLGKKVETMNANNRTHITGCLTTIIGGACVLLGLVLDATACHHFHKKWGDSFMLATTTFWGCDVAFFGVWLWLQSIAKDAKPMALLSDYNPSSHQKEM